MYKKRGLSCSQKALVVVVVLLVWTTIVPAQIIYNSSPDYYSVPMKRMLVQSVGNYINQVTQGQLDLDSATLMACQIYRINRLLSYNEGFDGDQTTPGMVLINAGKIDKARDRLSILKGDDKFRMLFELASYYLFKPGNIKSDLDSTKLYIDMASALPGVNSSVKWTNECNTLYGKYYAQLGDLKQSHDYFKKVIKSCIDQKDEPALAAALFVQARHLPFNAPEKLKILQQSLILCQKFKLKILETQVVGGMLDVHFAFGDRLVEEEIVTILELEKALGYRHLQYMYNVYAYMAIIKADYSSALLYAQQSIKYMNETGDKALSSLFYQRMGDLVSNVEGNEASISWYQKGLNSPKTKQTQVFWYKSFLAMTENLIIMHRYKESLTLIKSITSEFPPTNNVDQMNLYIVTGKCYEGLGEYNIAEKNYNMFHVIARSFPVQYIHVEFPGAYLCIANLYFKERKFTKSKYFLQKAISIPSNLKSVLNKVGQFELLFKIDSVEGNNISAIKNYQAYKLMYDSLNSIKQRQKYDELQVQFESVKKDRDIKLLKQNNELQDARLKKDAYYRNMILYAIALVSIIAGLLYYLYRSKQKSNIQLLNQQKVLEDLITEKEWLVKEIHHRVKNNLHTIVSLLESQSAYLNNDDALAAVRDSQHRVHAMSLIHQKLYMGDNMTTIDAADYIKEIVSYLSNSFKLGGRIIFQTEIDQVDIDVAIAVPIGLIINEAITNSIKYAFDKPGGLIKITLKESDEFYLLQVEDNGVGLPRDFNVNDRTRTLGMTLMRGLSKEIGAEFNITGYNGTSISILFPPYKLQT